MARTKTILGAALAIALVLGQATQVLAAPMFDPLIGTIDSISQGTDSGGNPIIIVNYTADGAPQVAELSLTDAEALGLITVDNTTDPPTITILPFEPGFTPIDLTSVQPEVDPCAPGSDTAAPTAVEGAVVAEDTEESSSETGGPVTGALCEFFNGSLGVTYDAIAGWHADGFGFGVIAQALFMAQTLGGDMTLAEEILNAKKTGDYSGLGLEADNWGQLKKLVMAQEVKSLTNLGAIMSGRATPLVTETATEAPTEVPTIVAGTNLMTTGHGKGGTHGKSGEEHGNGKGKNK